MKKFSVIVLAFLISISFAAAGHIGDVDAANNPGSTNTPDDPGSQQPEDTPRSGIGGGIADLPGRPSDIAKQVVDTVSKFISGSSAGLGNALQDLLGQQEQPVNETQR